MQAVRERITLTVAGILTGVALYGVPSWDHALTDVCHLAALFAGLTIAVLAVTRLYGQRGVAVERPWAAAFLAGMPVVYILSWVATGGGGMSRGWLAVELIALPIYGGLALLGLGRRPVLIPLGIAAHGLAWDVWHWHPRMDYIPSWYALGCLLADVGLATYFVVRLPAWRR